MFYKLKSPRFYYKLVFSLGDAGQSIVWLVTLLIVCLRLLIIGKPFKSISMSVSIRSYLIGDEWQFSMWKFIQETGRSNTTSLPIVKVGSRRSAVFVSSMQIKVSVLDYGS